MISGAVTGAGAAKRLSAVRWGLAGNILIAWVLTLPAAAFVGGLTYLVVRLLGEDTIGPFAVAGSLLAGAAFVLVRRLQAGSTLTAER